MTISASAAARHETEPWPDINATQEWNEAIRRRHGRADHRPATGSVRLLPRFFVHELSAAQMHGILEETTRDGP
jgi:hypothetical protein